MAYRVEAMKSHALAEQIKVETMGQLDSRKSPISRGFPEIVDMFPRTYGLEADEANFDFSDEIGWIVSANVGRF